MLLCTGFFSNCGEWGLLSSCHVRAYCSGFSCRAQAQQLWHMGLVAPRHVESSQTSDWTHVSCIGRQALIHGATQDILPTVYKGMCTILSPLQANVWMMKLLSKGSRIEFWQLSSIASSSTHEVIYFYYCCCCCFAFHRPFGQSHLIAWFQLICVSKDEVSAEGGDSYKKLPLGSKPRFVS